MCFTFKNRPFYKIWELYSPISPPSYCEGFPNSPHSLLTASVTAGAGSMSLSPCFVFVLSVQSVFKVFARQYKWKHICFAFKNISKLIKKLLKKITFISSFNTL